MRTHVIILKKCIHAHPCRFGLVRAAAVASLLLGCWSRGNQLQAENALKAEVLVQDVVQVSVFAIKSFSFKQTPIVFLTFAKISLKP